MIGPDAVAGTLGVALGGAPLGVVLAGGPARITAELRALAAAARTVVAADAGVRHARTLGRAPDLIVGDFDSASEEQLAPYADVARVTRPRGKDELDLELAVEAALERGARRLLLVGSLGGRLDQSLAALLIAARLRASGIPVSQSARRHDAHALQAGDALSLALPTGTVFSLLALADGAVVDVDGARFPLSRARLPFGVGLGVSNEADGGPRIRVHAGSVAVVVEWPSR